MTVDILEQCAKYGLGTVLSIGIYLVFVWLIKYILKMFYDLYMKALESIKTLKEELADHSRRAEENQKYVREEHKQMIDVLGRINGYKKD